MIIILIVKIKSYRIEINNDIYIRNNLLFNKNVLLKKSNFLIFHDSSLILLLVLFIDSMKIKNFYKVIYVFH